MQPTKWCLDSRCSSQSLHCQGDSRWSTCKHVYFIIHVAHKLGWSRWNCVCLISFRRLGEMHFNTFSCLDFLDSIFVCLEVHTIKGNKAMNMVIPDNSCIMHACLDRSMS